MRSSNLRTPSHLVDDKSDIQPSQRLEVIVSENFEILSVSSRREYESMDPFIELPNSQTAGLPNFTTVFWAMQKILK